MTRKLMMILAVPALGALALGGCRNQPAADESAEVPAEIEVAPEIEPLEPPRAAPEFTVPLVAGGETSLSDYRGKILVLDFWATWCAACVKELPDYQDLYDSWDRGRVAYLGMSLDGDTSTVAAFLKTRPEISLPMAVAPIEVVDSFLPKRTLPSSRVIDAEGMIRYEFTGPGAAKVGEAVRKLLAEQESTE